MRFYTKTHRFYCGVDLHADAMYVCIIDSGGETVVHKNIPINPKSFLRLIQPYREGLVVGCECMFSWYWLADLCADEGFDVFGAEFVCSQKKIPSRKPVGSEWISRLSKNERGYSFSYAEFSTP